MEPHHLHWVVENKYFYQPVGDGSRNGKKNKQKQFQLHLWLMINPSDFPTAFFNLQHVLIFCSMNKLKRKTKDHQHLWFPWIEELLIDFYDPRFYIWTSPYVIKLFVFRFCKNWRIAKQVNFMPARVLWCAMNFSLFPSPRDSSQTRRYKYIKMAFP